MNKTESFSLPLAMVVPVDVLETWLEAADAGERIAYAAGLDLPRDAESVQRVRRWQADGKVTLTAKRDSKRPGMWRYLVEKLSKSEQAAVATVEPGDAAAMQRIAQASAVLRELRRCALEGLPCPSNAELARIAKLPSGERGRQRARYLISCLVEAQQISVVNHGTRHPRVVTIHVKGRACGKSTARNGAGEASA